MKKYIIIISLIFLATLLFLFLIDFPIHKLFRKSRNCQLGFKNELSETYEIKVEFNKLRFYEEYKKEELQRLYLPFKIIGHGEKYIDAKINEQEHTFSFLINSMETIHLPRAFENCIYINDDGSFLNIYIKDTNGKQIHLFSCENLSYNIYEVCVDRKRNNAIIDLKDFIKLDDVGSSLKKSESEQ